MNNYYEIKAECLSRFMLFPTLSFANNEFNSVIEDFDRYFETQEPIKIEPKTSATISLSTRTGQANRGGSRTTTVTQQTKPEQRVKPSTPAKQIIRPSSLWRRLISREWKVALYYLRMILNLRVIILVI